MTGTSTTNEDEVADTEKEEEMEHDKLDAGTVCLGSRVLSGVLVMPLMAGRVLVVGLYQQFWTTLEII